MAISTPRVLLALLLVVTACGEGERDSDESWSQLSGWGIRAIELWTYLTMSGPDEDGAVLALDVQRAGHPVQVLSALTRDLAARGVTLVVVPVPKRLQVYPDRLPGIAPVEDFAGADVPWATLIVSLLEAGVQVIDLLPDFLAARYDESGEDDRLLYLEYVPRSRGTRRARSGGAETVWDDLERRGDGSGKRIFVWLFNAGAMGGTRLRKLDLDGGR